MMMMRRRSSCTSGASRASRARRSPRSTPRSCVTVPLSRSRQGSWWTGRSICSSSRGAALSRSLSQPRVLVVTGADSQVRVVESHAGDGETPYLSNTVTEISVGDYALVDHYTLVREADAAFRVGSLHASLGRASNFSSHTITLGGAIVRNEARVVLGGEGGECTLNGLSLATGRQLVDNQTTIDHAQPHCDSHELYKGILDGRSRAVFNGKIIVRLDAQKTDAKQSNKTLLLSEDAQITTKPQLEIFADGREVHARRHGGSAGSRRAVLSALARTVTGPGPTAAHPRVRGRPARAHQGRGDSHAARCAATRTAASRRMKPLQETGGRRQETGEAGGLRQLLFGLCFGDRR